MSQQNPGQPGGRGGAPPEQGQQQPGVGQPAGAPNGGVAPTEPGFDLGAPEGYGPPGPGQPVVPQGWVGQPAQPPGYSPQPQPAPMGPQAGYGASAPGYGAAPGFQPGVPAGYGAPPGAMPPGGPMPGGAPMPGFGAPPAQPPGTSSKNRLFLWLGIGCGGLLLLAVVGVVIAIWWARQRTGEAIDDLKRASSKFSATLETPPAPSSPVAAAAPEVAANRQDCKTAKSCCMALAKQSGSKPEALKGCEAFDNPAVPAAACTKALEGYRRVTKALGVSCE